MRKKKLRREPWRILVYLAQPRKKSKWAYQHHRCQSTEKNGVYFPWPCSVDKAWHQSTSCLLFQSYSMVLKYRGLQRSVHLASRTTLHASWQSHRITPASKRNKNQVLTLSCISSSLLSLDDHPSRIIRAVHLPFPPSLIISSVSFIDDQSIFSLVSFTSHLTSKCAFISFVHGISCISHASSHFHMHSHVYWLTNLSCTSTISRFYDCMCLPYLNEYRLFAIFDISTPSYLSCLDSLVSSLCFISLWPVSILHNIIVGSKKKKNKPLTPILYNLIFMILGYPPNTSRARVVHKT